MQISLRALLFSAAMAVMLAGTSCKKDDPNDPKTPNTPAPQYTEEQIIEDYADFVIMRNLQALGEAAFDLKNAVGDFIANQTDNNLRAARNHWYTTRKIWEQSEAFLFGPVADMELDPAIDTWPVNVTDMEGLLAGTFALDEEYMDKLNTSLKGFHPLEYLLFGPNRAAGKYTPRQLEYMKALADQIHRVTGKMYYEWTPAGIDFRTEFVNAGKGSLTYPTRQSALLQIADGLTGIIDEVGNGKLSDPFDARDSMLEESPFARNSFSDFANNITGAKNAYMGRYNGNQPKASLQSFVKRYNAALDLKITGRMDEIINSLNSFTVPFGRAIHEQPANVQSVINRLQELHEIMEKELADLIRLHAKS